MGQTASDRYINIQHSKHQQHSHPKMWGKLTFRVVVADVMSAAAVQRWKCQDYNRQCRGEAAFVTARSFHFYGKSKRYTPFLPQLPESAS
jgi:hypothetical protein